MLANPAAPPEVSEQPRVSDALARATLHALLDCDLLGVALVRSGDWTHVLTSSTYERLVGVRPLGRTISEVLSNTIAPMAMLESVVATGKAVRAPEVLVRTNQVGGSSAPVHVALTFLRVRRVTPDADGVLVVAQDMSQQVHEQRVGEVFAALANDMTGDRDETASVRSSVVHGSKALGADAASIFLLSPDGRRLYGALVGWDWIRTSFVVELDEWPNVKRALAANESVYLMANTAERLEEVWFEHRGIRAAICAPMATNGRILGVLFFDYVSPKPAKIDLALAKDIANQCARLVARAAANARSM